MIDTKEEADNVRELVAKYEESLATFKKDPKQKLRVDAIRAELRNLENELRDYDKRQKELN